MCLVGLGGGILKALQIFNYTCMAEDTEDQFKAANLKRGDRIKYKSNGESYRFYGTARLLGPGGDDLIAVIHRPTSDTYPQNLRYMRTERFEDAFENE